MVVRVCLAAILARVRGKRAATASGHGDSGGERDWARICVALVVGVPDEPGATDIVRARGIPYRFALRGRAVGCESPRRDEVPAQDHAAHSHERAHAARSGQSHAPTLTLGLHERASNLSGSFEKNF